MLADGRKQGIARRFETEVRLLCIRQGYFGGCRWGQCHGFLGAGEGLRPLVSDDFDDGAQRIGETRFGIFRQVPCRYRRGPRPLFQHQETELRDTDGSWHSVRRREHAQAAPRQRKCYRPQPSREPA